MAVKKSKHELVEAEATGQPKIRLAALTELTPNPVNPRRHGRAQIRALAKSIKAFGFTAPILVDRNNQIAAGEARWAAAQYLALSTVPVICLDHLTDVQIKAYVLADNQLATLARWDDEKLALVLRDLSAHDLTFDMETIGFEAPEIDFRIQSLQAADAADIADEFDLSPGPGVSVLGDLWNLDPHYLLCGNSLDPAAYATLMQGRKACGVFTDPPYNVKIDGHVCGNGSVAHREFIMASGEMSQGEFTRFLSASMALMCANTTAGAIAFVCMDWRHIEEILAAARSCKCDMLNLCVWAKSNAGMGSLYRSRHELVFVFKNGADAHLNNIQLGRFGRNRTNVWNYAGASNFPRKGSKRALDLHPTVKPIALVADAILDSTNRDDVILDPFMGSGTSILAAQRTGRRCYGIEIDPLYVDTAIQRWQRLTGREAKDSQGATFAERMSKRTANS
jgi:DNA modification methylase